MKPRRYRFDKDLETVVEVHDHNGPEVVKAHNFVPDIRPFVTQCGTEITSRSKLREYEQRTGSKQVGTDWCGPERPVWWDQHRERERARGR